VFRNLRSAGLMLLVAVVGGGVPPAVYGSAPSAVGASPPYGYRLAQWPQPERALNWHLVDDRGRPRSLTDYRGRVLVVYFGFARCPDVCPAELFTLSRAMKRLAGARSGCRVLFITLDPGHDSPAALRRYLAGFDSAFVGLTGAVAAINQAAADFNVEFAHVPDGAGYTVEHSNSIFILDKRGRVRLVGNAATGAEDLAHDLRALGQE
jgi:protein SCO1/2